jgi:hypothetical protein
MTIVLMASLYLVRIVYGEVVFSTTFDYSGGDPIVGTDAGNLNGADGQIGLFSGFIPLGTQREDEELMAIATTSGVAGGDTFLLVDRAEANFAFSANLSSPIEILNSSVSFDYATRRTSGLGQVKDNSIIGFGSDDEELFHVVISANTSETPGVMARVGVMQEGETIFDLPTAVGEDADSDLIGFNGNTDSDMNAIGSFILNFDSEAYIIRFDNGANSYITDALAYNGAASDLARIEFRGQGGDTNQARSGFWLDDIMVDGVIVSETPLCDFDEDGLCSGDDVNALMNEVASGNNTANFDLTADGLVDDNDRDAWLASAGPLDGLAGAFLLGDSNLDGTVNALDLNVLGISWQSTNANWTDGNFTGANTDVADLNVLALNWQQSVAGQAQSVPEPSSFPVLAAFLGLMPNLRRRFRN